jgi:hypothetical protein
MNAYGINNHRDTENAESVNEIVEEEKAESGDGEK